MLSNVATVTFLLVFALALRMFVNREIFDPGLGAALGVAYAGTLIGYGYYRHARSTFVIPVFSVSGALLLCAIVYETHTRFGQLSTPVAYVLLAGAMIAMTGLALRFHAALPLWVGVVGVALTGLAIDYPELDFPRVAGLLLLANGAAYFGIRIPRGRGVVWVTLTATLFFWSVWTAKVRHYLLRDATAEPGLAVSWFLPAVAVFAAGYAAMVVWSVIREGWSYPSLEKALPIINVAWAYWAARGLVVADQGSDQGVALVGSCAALAHIGLAVLVARHKGAEKRPTTTFSVAAVFLLAISLPAAVGNMYVTVLIWSAVASCLAVLSWIRENRLSRGLAYLFQTFTCVVAASTGVILALDSWTAFPASLVLTASCAFQYGWCRRRQRVPETLFFRSAAVLLLLATFAYGFSAARILLFAMLGAVGVEVQNLFQFGQSLLLDVGALVLMYLALQRRNGEMLVSAFLAVALCAAKVFGYDLAHVQDLPLVLSVFAFGVTAAVSSLAWKRWRLQERGRYESRGKT